MRTSNKHNSLEELFSAIAEVIRCNLGHNQQLYTTDFSSAIVDDMYGCVDYRVKSIIDRSIEYITEEDLRSITKIKNYAFYGCTNLALTSLPEGITSIGTSAFYYCMNLRTITFKGTPTSINSTAFGGCSNLATINVPWSEGEVAGAPWGATKATINYNYTGG